MQKKEHFEQRPHVVHHLSMMQTEDLWTWVSIMAMESILAFILPPLCFLLQQLSRPPFGKLPLIMESMIDELIKRTMCSGDSNKLNDQRNQPFTGCLVLQMIYGC